MGYVMIEEFMDKYHYDSYSGCFRYKNDFRHKSKGDVVGTVNVQGYRMLTWKHRNYLVHRLVWLAETGEWPRGITDHINADKLDNRFENLRDTNQRINRNNPNNKLDRRNKCGYKHVSWAKRNQKWALRFQVSKDKYKHFGYFDCPTAAYLECLRLKSGEYVYEG